MPLFNPPQLRWNDTDGTYEFVLKGGNVTLQIGQESNQRVLNHNLGYTLLNGRVVRVMGAQGNRTAVDYAVADSDTNSMTVLGVVTEDIANNQQGFITTEGLVRDIDTSAFAEGAVIWLSPTTPGALTTTKPAAPQHLVMVGYCIRSHAVNGSILVKVQNGYELDELHNVLITAAANGDVLTYDAATGVWKNVPPAAGGVSSVNGQTGDVTVFTGGLATVAVVGALPGTPNTNTLYIVTG